MITKNKLLLASSSASRLELMRNSRIPFEVITQTADEAQCDWGLPLQQLTQNIALAKMEHAILPQGIQGQICFVLTADTLGQDVHGVTHGKPTSYEDAVSKLKVARDGMLTCCTSFCLDKKIFVDGAWQLETRIVESVEGGLLFVVPDDWIEQYLQNSSALSASGAITIEGYGDMFLKSVSGSYSTIVGLPMFEVRQALSKLGFF